MAQFTYKARSKSGEVMEGLLESSDRAGAMSQLKGDGLFPVSIELAKGKAAKAKRSSSPTKALNAPKAIQENKNIELEKEKMESKQKSEEQQIQLEKDKLENEKQKQEMDAERLSRAEKCDRAETMSRNKNLSKEMRKKIDNVLLKCLDVETFTVKKMNAKLSTEQLLIPTNTRNI